ncbi:MAG TPA: hypothetical protein VFZ62_01760 [Candidatus Saccharimonadales bacterium]
MPYSIETITTLSPHELSQAAELTAAGFGRENDAHNLQDTEDHLLGADVLQVMRRNQELLAFAAYRRPLWQPRN